MARNILPLHPRYISSSVPGLVKWVSFGHTLPSQLCILPACRTVVAMSIMCNVQCAMCNVQCAMCRVAVARFWGPTLQPHACSASPTISACISYLYLYMYFYLYLNLYLYLYIPVFVHSRICTYHRDFMLNLTTLEVCAPVHCLSKIEDVAHIE